MTKLGNLINNIKSKLYQETVNIGDVHLLELDKKNGITPKNDDRSRSKFFIVLGFNNKGYTT